MFGQPRERTAARLEARLLSAQQDLLDAHDDLSLVHRRQHRAQRTSRASSDQYHRPHTRVGQETPIHRPLRPAARSPHSTERSQRSPHSTEGNTEGSSLYSVRGRQRSEFLALDTVSRQGDATLSLGLYVDQLVESHVQREKALQSALREMETAQQSTLREVADLQEEKDRLKTDLRLAREDRRQYDMLPSSYSEGSAHLPSRMEGGQSRELADLKLQHADEKRVLCAALDETEAYASHLALDMSCAQAEQARLLDELRRAAVRAGEQMRARIENVVLRSRTILLCCCWTHVACTLRWTTRR